MKEGGKSNKIVSFNDHSVCTAACFVLLLAVRGCDCNGPAGPDSRQLGVMGNSFGFQIAALACHFMYRRGDERGRTHYAAAMQQ